MIAAAGLTRNSGETLVIARIGVDRLEAADNGNSAEAPDNTAPIPLTPAYTLSTVSRRRYSADERRTFP